MRRTYQYAAVTKDEAQRRPSALLRAMSLPNGRWTFYEAGNLEVVDFSTQAIIIESEALRRKSRGECRRVLTDKCPASPAL